MATFSKSLENRGKISQATSRPAPGANDNNIGLLRCNDMELYFFNPSTGANFNAEKDYEMLITHLAIPKFFQKVNVRFGTPNSEPTKLTPSGEVLSGISDNGDYAYNALFATLLKEVNPEEQTPTLVEKINGIYSNVLETTSIKKHGRYNCGLSVASTLFNKNIEDMVFYFNSHYFIPFALMNGQSCYFASENNTNLIEFIDGIKNGGTQMGGFLIRVDSPIINDSVLGISYAFDVSLVPVNGIL